MVMIMQAWLEWGRG